MAILIPVNSVTDQGNAACTALCQLPEFYQGHLTGADHHTVELKKDKGMPNARATQAHCIPPPAISVWLTEPCPTQ